MRLIPVITAILLALTLYALVLERDALLAFARGSDAARQARATETGAPPKASAASTADTESTAVGVVVLRSSAQTVDSAVVLRGQTRADRQVQVRAETSATVISEPLRKGAYVETGDLLCQLDPGTREARLAEARAKLTEATSRVPESEARLIEAKARLEEAKVNWNAASKLSRDGYASETRLISSQATVATAKAGIKAAESGLEATRAGIESAAAAVAAAKRELDKLVIKAPFGGLLESDTAELGSLMQPGSLCATVIRLDPIKLVGFVPETEVDRVSVGAQAGARLVSGREVRGRVTFLSRSADPTTRTFEVEIAVDNADLSIRDGQTAEILISAAGARAHLLPQSSLTLNNEGKLGVRTVDADNLVDFRPVEMLRDSPEGVWITGLPDQVDVIIVGQDFVTKGVKVAPTLRESLDVPHTDATR
jgi:membrane fusion protein, multidrug efflux system